MTLTPYQAAILTADLALPKYNGMTAAQAWTWLTAPNGQQQTVTVNTGVLLTPATVAKLLGPTKANAIAAAFLAAFPQIGPSLLASGVDPLDADTQAFMGQLVAAGTITQADAAALLALATTQVTVGPPQPNFDAEFSGQNWPSVTDAGQLDPTGNSKAINGFPNCGELLQADFNACWAAAGRS